MKKILGIIILGLLLSGNVVFSSDHKELICTPETRIFSSDGISLDDKSEKAEDASDSPAYKLTKRDDKWCILKFQECSDPVSDWGDEINIVIDSAMDFNTNEVIEMPFIQRMQINRYTGKYVNTSRIRKKDKKDKWIEELRFMRIKGSCSLEERKF
jgi:hypothetical protein